MELKNKELVYTVKFDRDDTLEDIYVLCINSTFDIGWLGSQINRYLSIFMKYSKSIAITDNKKKQSENIQIFSNLPKSNPTYSQENLLLNNTPIKTKFWLIQCRSKHFYLYPKIKQLDYFLLSNYPVSSLKSVLLGMDEINFIMELTPNDLGPKFSSLLSLIK